MIGAVYCELIIYDVNSLKAKRAVLKSVLTRLKQRYNVAVAETNYQDVWQRAELSIVTVASDRRVAERELQRSLSLIDGEPALERALTNYEWL
ncbi:DUF503 domain-containing protein [Halalkalibacterium halodurans]|uniref:DUF503 domain-containing protein n=1 Tax=Halalkalibacterium halodurans TaxID=86665 RepID=A0A0M0KMY7_ALKHA|nr:DUF503 domain-containing protein [Halalkalibacterium halodurans]MDY7222960.1 DUF503 domain-containing protein [Halalkalibacterium halodurans]MDY7242181.1 DUF503 domain-containing protein [Halalkalibacterium halodurans]MED3646211.1 DUF503 domain-containing protein [Halalkalibacterium halodurans]MED4080077.1 DUF503 domain-containing protein [Halalkalibacterium halodurans]MED4086844.1 DUF503 domain-containing protein [Halalkalibacterium halodurans]